MAAARRRLTLPAIAAALVAATAPAGGQAATSPVGIWRTFSDRTGQESGRVQIWQQDGLLYGRVVEILDPAKRAAVCRACTDDRRGRPVIGLQIIRGLHPDDAVWDGGDILDPETGDTYRCRIRLVDGGARLVVRGFLGVSLFGRSQTWVRVAD